MLHRIAWRVEGPGARGEWTVWVRPKVGSGTRNRGTKETFGGRRAGARRELNVAASATQRGGQLVQVAQFQPQRRPQPLARQCGAVDPVRLEPEGGPAGRIPAIGRDEA